MPFTPLTPDQLDAAQDWLDQVDLGAVERGTALKRDGKALEPETAKNGSFRSTVIGGSLYRNEFDWDGVSWVHTCTCPVGQDCKHGVAAMQKAIEKTRKARPNPEQGESAGRKKPSLQSFAAEMTDRLGRRLSPDETRIAQRLEDIYERYRHDTKVPATYILALTTRGRYETYKWDTIQVWPRPLQSRWEMWLYIAAFFRREGFPMHPDWEAMTDQAEIERVVGEWDRQERVLRWQRTLEEAEANALQVSEPLVELRAVLTEAGVQLEWRKTPGSEFRHVPVTHFQTLLTEANQGKLPFDEASMPIWHGFNTGYGALPFRTYTERDTPRILNRILRDPATEERVLGPSEKPLRRPAEPLTWRTDLAEGAHTDYHLALVRPDGTAPPTALIIVPGKPPLYITAEEVLQCPPLANLDVRKPSITIPAEALESAPGVALLEQIGLEPPARVAAKVRTYRAKPVLECSLEETESGDSEHLILKVFSESEPGVRDAMYARAGWQPLPTKTKDAPDLIVRHDRSALTPVSDWLATLKVSWWMHGNHWHKPVGKKFAEQFSAWLATIPPDVTVLLDPALSSFRNPTISAKVRLDVQESGIDWFDVKIALDVPDTTLTKAELKALLDARGGFVRLGAKGWRRLTFQLSEEDEAQLADLGLSASDFSGDAQRLHALQLAGKQGARRLLSEEHTQIVERRAEEIRTRVSPPVPTDIKAELRPYQVEGFHFLAYLSSNRFGGILADDMGLGKTLQTLTWLMWLRDPASGVEGSADASRKYPSLVICPKSVTDNWRAEASHFTPELRVKVLPRGATAATLAAARKESDLVVANYVQLRLLDKQLTAEPWYTVILDEAQAIKNPESQTAKAAWKLRAAHRLALSGTPIENRLLDLWSIMQFSMPGVLGQRSTFSKTFDQRSDPFARRRLSARVRPFVLRRTKSEVAKDLPERIEEDLLCELDGPQATLYSAELKRARASLLKLKTQAEFDKGRFSILTSLLRLRQICCHPALVSSKSAKAESAKLSALIELLDPLLAEGHKVLVFSQFVEMLSLIRTELQERDWKHFLLTGETEDRGSLVNQFQSYEGAAVFLISLRAGGFGLNLTAASYVVLFDPWWNPAVENQAIDRTHRIGQRNTVIAYRLLVKETIEEKIRSLQTQKRALATDVLGEENFARALTMDDFHFLLGE